MGGAKTPLEQESDFAFNLLGILEKSRHSLVGTVFRPDISNLTKHEHEGVFLRRLPLSKFLAKTLKVNKIAVKSLLKICG